MTASNGINRLNSHHQRWVKVNTLVDSDIAPLIRILNSFPSLQTIESCQGSRNKGARVFFHYGNYYESSWKEISDFVFGFLGPELVKKCGDRIDILVRITTFGKVLAELHLRPGNLKIVVGALKQIRKKLPRCYLP